MTNCIEIALRFFSTKEIILNFTYFNGRKNNKLLYQYNTSYIESGVSLIETFLV